jgi:hypothetical protein
MLCMEIITVCSENHTKPINILNKMYLNLIDTYLK